jgi:hypothetical protein
MGRLLRGEYLTFIIWYQIHLILISYERSYTYLQDINFGERFSRDFVDSREDMQTWEGVVNQHNNEAGRKVRNYVCTG